MYYSDFIKNIKAFATSFFFEMGKQIDLAIEKDWGKVKIDKQRLVKEHQERKDNFYSSIALLEQEIEDKINWIEIKTLFNRMINEIK